MGAPFPLFDAPVDDAAERIDSGVCGICGRQAVARFALGVGDGEAAVRPLVTTRFLGDADGLALLEAASPYAGAVAAVCDLLPGPSSADVAAARALAQTGPPTEQVGLDGYGFDAGPTSLLPTGARR